MIKIKGLFLLLLCCIAIKVLGQSKQPVDYVNTFVGVDNGGNVLPGPCLPFSIIRLNPIVTLPHPTSGYATGKPVTGFVQTGTSGTGGGGRYGNFALMAMTGNPQIESYSTPLDNETASVGRYSAHLTKSDIGVDLTCTEKVGFTRFTFPKGARPIITINASSVIDLFRNNKNDGQCLEASVKVNPDGVIEGYGKFVGGWGHMQPYMMYFAATFNKPFLSSGTWKDTVISENAKEVKGKRCGAFFRFSESSNTAVMVKVGVSVLSVDKAKKSLKEQKSVSFEAALERNRKTWNALLSKIWIEGGTEDQRVLFYTGLYRTYVMPTDITGENPAWQSKEPQFWDFYCIWDTFRCAFPLITLITPEKQSMIVRGLIDIYRHVGWLPDAWVAGSIARQQGGTNADVVLADAAAKKLKGIDWKTAYEAMLKNANEPVNEKTDGGVNLGKFKEYIDSGYVPANKQCSVSYTLEYAYNDFCTSQVAKKMGKTADYQKYLKRSLNCYNLFNPDTKFFWAKKSDGQWAPDFSPTLQGNTWWRGAYYYEGTPWHYSMDVLQDIKGLVQRHGGNEKFTAFLDEFFDGRYYTQENEPDIHAPYLYDYINKPYKTAERVRELLDTKYQNKRTGLPGNDDSGCMSSWYVFSSMGFYPIAGQDLYLIGSPLFSHIKIDLGNGKFFIIIAHNASKQNKYITTARFNGKIWDRAWFRHYDIIHGAVLELEMGSSPSDWGIKGETPPSYLEGGSDGVM